MKSLNLSVEEMEAGHVVRYKKLQYMGVGKESQGGRVPREVYRMLAAPAYAINAPIGDNGPWSEALVHAPGYVSIIAEIPPYEGVPLHMHYKTHEAFMPLTGQVKINWGDDGENEILLDQYDTIAVPPMTNRRFSNPTGETVIMLVLISGGVHDLDDLVYSPDVGEKIQAGFGDEVSERLQTIGFRFTAGRDE